MSKLSPTQSDCVKAAASNNGVLCRYAGGFWSARDVEMKTSMGAAIPAWHFSTNTIRALIDRGVFEVLEEQKSQRGAFPTAVKLTTNNQGR